MTLDNFTIKAQEAVQEAVNSAQRASQQVIEPVHILKGVMEKAPDVVTFIFQKLGVNSQHIAQLVDSELQHLPRVQGGQPYLSADANQVLVKAQDISKNWGDQFVSVEPVLLALLEVNSTASRILKDAGINAKDAEKAIQELRQVQRNMPRTWWKTPAPANSTLSSGETMKSEGCCKSFHDARRTTLS